MSEISKQLYHFPNLSIINLIGQGGMSHVWRARQISLDRLVAIKVLSKNFVASNDDIHRFLQEARACAKLQHPNIMRVYDVNYADGVYYIVMELIDGYTLGEWLRRKTMIPSEDAMIILESVAYALNYAWSSYKVVHCDLKPDNIMVDGDGTIKVTDLGLARSLHAIQPTVHDEVIGTPAYMSPEQAYAARELDCRSDIYSLGATVYHLLTGRSLFAGMPVEQMLEAHVGEAQAPDVRQFNPQVSKDLAMLLERMLMKDRTHRYENWQALLDDIQSLYAGHPANRPEVAGHASSMCLRK